MDANYFEKLEQIVDKLMEKHIPLSAKNVEESKEILALCQYYKISRALAKQSKQPRNCNLPTVSKSLKCDCSHSGSCRYEVVIAGTNEICRHK